MLTIARFTILKIFEPAFIFLFIFGTVLCYMTSGTQGLDLSFFTDLVNADASKGNLNMGAFLLLILTSIISIFVGSTEIPRDLNTRMITILLSKPISRQSYVIGRFLGTWALSAILYIAWHLVSSTFQFFSMPDLFNYGHFFINLLYVFSLAPICAIAVTISTYLDDVPAMIVSFIIVSLCFSMGSVPIIVAFFPAELGRLLLIFYYMLPNLGFLFQSVNNPYQIMAFLVYTFTASAIVLKIAVMHFDDRDLIEG